MAVAFSNDSLEIETAMQLFYHTLSEKERRRYVAVEAVKLGYGGQSYLASVVGCNRDTVAIIIPMRLPCCGSATRSCDQEVVSDQTKGHRRVSRKLTNPV